MDKNLALILLFILCLVGPCLVFAACGKASITALGRNPSAAPRILQTMIIVLVFAEAAAIIGLLIIYQLFD
jgi:F0F1-type ATP synthase membrane subunit c/vacuolar-type H+-ATPase subunit K